MSEDLICPDCGGMIGGDPAGVRQACRCFEERRTAVVVAPEPVDETPQQDLSEQNLKICRVCGRDLRGHRRLKDSRGYICIDCDAAERGIPPKGAEQDLNVIPCPECGRKLKPEGITTLNGNVMCKRCAAEFKELHKYKAPPPGVVDFKAAEKAQLQKLLLYAGVLLVIMALAYFGFIGRH